MKTKILAIIAYVSIYISLFILFPLIGSSLTQQPFIQILANLIGIAPIYFVFNLFISFFLFLAGIMFLQFLELRKARDAYINSRNRVGFIKDGQAVCFEGEIEPKEGWSPLLSPISQKECVFYCYGNKYVGGGASQIKTVIKPSGDSIPLNGWLSGDYVENREFDPQKTKINHFFSFMMEKKSKEIKEQDVAKAPYFYKIPQGTIQKDNFVNHEILDSLDKEVFNKHEYTEILIPTGMYGWVLGRWDKKNKQLLPLRFSSSIYVIEKDYKESFLKYISKYRKRHLLGIFSLILLAIMLSLPIYLPILLG